MQIFQPFQTENKLKKKLPRPAVIISVDRENNYIDFVFLKFSTLKYKISNYPGHQFVYGILDDEQYEHAIFHDSLDKKREGNMYYKPCTLVKRHSSY